MMPKFGNGNGKVHKTKDQLYYNFFFIKFHGLNLDEISTSHGIPSFRFPVYFLNRESYVI